MSRLNRKRNRRKKNKRILKKVFFNLSIIIMIVFASLYINFKNIKSHNTYIKNDNEKVIEAISKSNKTSTVTLSAIGDVMAHKPQLDAQYDSSSNTYNFDNNFKYVKSILEKSDISIANLETTLAGPSTPYTSYPSFNTPDALIDGLKYAGIDVLSTINNHSFDKGDLGVERTLKISKEKGFDTIGTTLNEKDEKYIIKNINDITLGISAFSYGEILGNDKYLNGIKISDKSKNKMNIFDGYDAEKAFEIIKKELENIKSTDIQVLLLHWGNEYSRTPSKFQKSLAKKLSDYGVDIIIGSHTHVVQPVEIIKSSDNKNETLVVYSLGNFISNQRKELLGSLYTEDGLIIQIKITKDFKTNKTYISSVENIPIWVNKYKTNSKDIYEVIPISDKKLLNSIKNLPKDKIKESYNNTISQIKVSDIIKVPPNPFD